MASVVFLQRELEDRLGAMLLTACAAKHGHRAEIVVDPLRHVRRVVAAKPDFIAMTVLSPSLPWARRVAAHFKRLLPGVRIVFGGPHPTFLPECIAFPEIDIICIGEGERPLVRMLERYDGTLESIRDTPGLWVKTPGGVIKNPRFALLTADELSELPFADRRHYAGHPVLRRSPHWRTWTSRGCPYKCTFCFEPLYTEMNKGQGPVVRQRTVASAVAELKHMKELGAKYIDIVDDQFLLARKWTLEFCEAYREHVGLPLVVNTLANHLDEERVRALKHAGVHSICFGIESGVERIRMETYRKPVKDETIFSVAELLRRHGIDFLTFNILGLPEESLEDMYATVRINQQIGTTYPWCSIFQPYPGSPLGERYGMGAGEQFSYSYFQESVLGDGPRRALVANAHKLFAHAVKANLSFDAFARLARHTSPLRKLYTGLFYWHYGDGLRRRYGHSWPGLAKHWVYANARA
jgi:radical SAM superfamily enzyme YgiQ (UPF0313 family)